MTPKERQHRFRVFLAFGLVYFFWGSTYIGIRIAVEHIPPALLSGMRFVTAGLVMLAYCAFTGRRIRLTAKDAFLLAVMGVLLLTGGNMGLAYSEQYIPSGLSALIVAVVPLWVALIEGFILRGERLKGRGWLGLGLGLVGLVVLLWPQLAPLIRHGLPQSSAGRMFLAGSAVLLLGSLCWSVGSIISRRTQLSVDPFAATAWEMTIGGTVNMIIALSLNQQHTVIWTARGVSAVIYLTIFGSLVGFTAYIWLLEHVPTAKVATYAYVNPVVAVLLGWLILHEEINRYIVVGAVIIVGSVVLVTLSKLKSPATQAAGILPACEAEA
jgi:drug/metabolite transporter (DMT)-like permease